MLSTVSYLVALLPALTLGQSIYTVTVAGVETEVVLPPFPTGDAAEGDTGVTIPITIGNQITSVVLPYFDGATPTVPVTVDSEAAPTEAVESVVEEASDAVDSAVEEASDALSSVSADATEAASSIAEVVESVTSSVAAGITDAVEEAASSALVSSEVDEDLSTVIAETTTLSVANATETVAEFEGSAPQIARSSSLAVVLAGLVAFFFSA
ncbi:MAG: hypothetical protein M1815_003885 [Lichina confinis]|nr:MAG: hypothetical protein M1815_003885 [Lichina confinis]